jgi:hypothetical protein
MSDILHRFTTIPFRSSIRLPRISVLGTYAVEEGNSIKTVDSGFERGQMLIETFLSMTSKGPTYDDDIVGCVCVPSKKRGFPQSE